MADFQNAQAAVSELSVLTGISAELERWSKADQSDADRSMCLAQLVVMLGQIDPESTIPSELLGICPALIGYLTPGVDVHLKRNAAALLTGLISFDEPTWRSLVVDNNEMVPAVVATLTNAATPENAPVSDTDAAASTSSSSVDVATAINMMAALTAAAQGGEEGAQSVVNAGAVSLVCTLLQHSDNETTEQVLEGGSDLLCQLGTYDSCKSVLLEQGCVPALSTLLGRGVNQEVRVRVLLCLGMLTPSSSTAQQQLVQNQSALLALLAAIKQDEDQDAKEIAKSLFAGLAKVPECKPHIETALRANMAAAAPEAAST